MAQQDITIGAANAGNGDTLFAAFTKVQANFTELYTDDAGDVNSVTATAPLSGTSTTGAITLSLSDDSIKEVKLDCTNSPTDNYLLSYDSASSGFTWVAGVEGDITGVTAGDGLTGGGTSGTVSLAVGVDDSTIELDSDAVRVKDNGITLAKMAGLARGKFIYGDASGDPAALAVGANGKLLVADANGDPSWTTVSGDATLSAGAVTIANDAVTSAKMGAEYTTSDVLSPSSTVTCATNDHDIFTLAIDQATVVNFTGVVAGMSKTVVVTGNGTHSPTLTNINGSGGTFNRISGTYTATSSTKNFIQLKFVSTSEAWYTISQIAS
tara:strand:+ start:78 stop:1052 length:975 start_codon:yes stop_codon:yes gene_type:complete